MSQAGWHTLRYAGRWLLCGLMGLLGGQLHAAGAARACGAAALAPAALLATQHAGQVWVPGGEFMLGSDEGYADEAPPLRTSVKGFWMDRTEVTNAQFAAFVKATAYVSEAERQGSGAVFTVPDPDGLRSRPLAWWRFVKGANWRQPQGPGSSLRGHEQAPVVLVTQADALAYARWLGRDLPTEAEWEYAAKARKAERPIVAGPRDASGRPTANYWQGNFPLLDTAEDGHAGLAPVGCYAPNALGLYDMIGNAWEWTKDRDQGPRQGHANGDAAQVRPLLTTSQPRPDPASKVVIKGGSFLCSPDYCVRYRASAREAQEPDLPTAHVGFRTVSRR
jgi:sulfatase modifying factor 1